MTYDLWKTECGNDEFIGIFTSLKEAVDAGNIKHKELDGMPRTSIYIEWVADEFDYHIQRYSDSEDWIFRSGEN